MGLVQHGKYYWLDIRIKGKRIRRSLRTANKFLALDRYKEKKDELFSEYGKGKIRFSDFCKQYLEWAWSSKPASTLREKQRLEKIKAFFSGLGIVFLDDITPYHIEQLKAELKDWKLSKSTINGYLQILRGMFNKAIIWEIYDKGNPLKKVRFYRSDPTISPLSKSDIEKAIEFAEFIAKKPRSSVQKIFPELMRLALNTGMRKSEILNLKWTDIREDEIAVKGKGDKVRSVPLNQKAREIIERQPPRDKYIFDIPNRRQINLFKRTTERISWKIGRRFHFHLLRHAFASNLIEKGVDVVTISEILGHSKIIVSLGYTHTSKERKQRAVELLN